MNYKVGDKVKIRQDLSTLEHYGGFLYTGVMQDFAKEHDFTGTIEHVSVSSYILSGNPCNWTREMLDGLVEEASKTEEKSEIDKVLEKWHDDIKKSSIVSDTERPEANVEFVHIPTRRSCLEQATEIVCKDREDTYGKPEDNFELIARYWENYLGFEGITGHDVAMMMELLKIARIQTGKYKEDNYIDLCGYAACACEIGAKEDEEKKIHGDL